jgi:hypothetical protein
MLGQLRGSLEETPESEWRRKVRAVLTKKQSDQFDANNEG